MAIREGRWDCSSCGSKAIYGRHVDCPGCGRPRPAGVRFYLIDDAPAVVDAARLAEARAGADWICLHCEASNRATVPACAGCGAPRGSSPTQGVHDYAAGAVPRTGEAPRTGTPAKALASGAPAKALVSGAAAASGSRWILPAVGAVFLGLFVLIGWAVSAAQRSSRVDTLSSYVLPDPVPAVVVGKRWERRVAVQLRSLVPGEGYAVPESALVLAREQRQTGTRQVVDHYVTATRQVPRTISIPDGYEEVTREVEETVQTGTRTYVCGQRDLGNGYFEDRECTEPEYETRTRTVRRREPRYRYETRMETVTERTPVYRTVPVHRTWYRYNSQVWRDTFYIAKGDTTEPAWPQVEATPDRRELERTEFYYVALSRGPGQTPVEAEIIPEHWGRYRPGQRVSVRERPFSFELLPADSLPACIQWRAGTTAAAADSLGCTPPPSAGSAAAPGDSSSAPRDSAAADSTA